MSFYENYYNSSLLNKNYISIINRKRKEYSYASIYDGENCILKPQYVKNEQVIDVLGTLDDYVIITNDETSLPGKKCSYDPNILSIVNKYVEKEDVNPHLVNPEYLKLTEAEESKK